MISLSIIDNLLKRFQRLNKIMDFMVSKIFRSMLVAGACPSNYEYLYDTHLGYECWASTSCGSNKCVRVFSRTYYYSTPPYTCEQLFKVCNSTTCYVISDCG